MRAYGKSDIGKVRKTNEDSYICNPPAIFMVADGMGGHAAGEIASSLCVKAVVEYVQKAAPAADLREVLKEAVLNANETIWQAANTQLEYAGMGTTVTVLYLDGDNVFWGHVGDSRLYLISEEKITQITADHSVVGELLQNGSITEEEALFHPKRNMLTRAVGTAKDVLVDTGVMVWQQGDKLLLCSDGLTNMVRTTEMLKIINEPRESSDLQLVVDKLIAQANDAGGFDNITTVLIARD
ncbi:MAG: Stp1/IreP family PP2C-type Ser/Thr phosphatase [Sporomusaceae bacterium]|nr:Stp1/IreP family PP2C-type Ser/Thr phosphatase [Sporomusaceae bacterium]